MLRGKMPKYKVNHVTFMRDNTLDDFVSKRNVNNIVWLKVRDFQSLYEWLLLHNVTAEEVNFYGVDEERINYHTEYKYEKDQLVMLVATRTGTYDFYPLCELYFD